MAVCMGSHVKYNEYRDQKMIFCALKSVGPQEYDESLGCIARVCLEDVNVVVKYI